MLKLVISCPSNLTNGGRSFLAGTYYLHVSLTNWKSDNHQGSWDTLRRAVTPWYQGGLTDGNLSIAFSNGGSIEICFNDKKESMEKAGAKLLSEFPGRYTIRTEER